METKDILKEAGLTKIESKVYLALLKLGSAKAGKISKEAQLNRTTVYDALNRLIEKGLVSSAIKSNTQWFSPENPKRFKEILKEKQQAVDSTMPLLIEMFKSNAPKKAITVYRGKKGIKSVFEDMLRTNETVSVIDSGGVFRFRMPYYSPHFIREVEKKKLKIKNLVREGVDVKPTKTTEVRFLPKNVESVSVVEIYGDKVAIVVWTETPEAVVIKNKSVAASFKSYFDVLWNSAKKS